MKPEIRPQQRRTEALHAADEGQLSRYRIELFWSREDERFVATAPQFGHRVRAFGSTPGEALRGLEAVLQTVEARYRQEGRRLPKGPGYSGQLRVRLPRSLHAALASAARREGVSLNTLIVSYLSERAGDDSVFAQLREQFDDSASPKDYRRAGD